VCGGRKETDRKRKRENRKIRRKIPINKIIRKGDRRPEYKKMQIAET